MAALAVQGGSNPLFQNNVIFVVLLWGGLTTNLIWCLLLNARNKTFSDYTNSKAPLSTNYLFAALAGTTWFLQFSFMAWAKVSWATALRRGSCIWRLSFWYPVCGALLLTNGKA
jgi:hypothetical protein